MVKYLNLYHRYITEETEIEGVPKPANEMACVNHSVNGDAVETAQFMLSNVWLLSRCEKVKKSCLNLAFDSTGALNTSLYPLKKMLVYINMLLNVE